MARLTAILATPFMRAYAVFFACGVALCLFTTQDGLFRWSNSLHSPTGDALAPWLTLLGDGRTAALLPVVLWFVYRPLAWRAALALILTLALVQLGKQILFPDALRPTAYFEAMGTRVNHLIQGVELYRNQSFPSGHTAAAFAMAAILCLLRAPLPFAAVKPTTRQLWLLTGAFLVGYTRVYLAQHFFEDVVAGSLVGVTSVTLWIWAWPIPSDSHD